MAILKIFQTSLPLTKGQNVLNPYLAKGLHPYPLCHAYRQMDDKGWVGQAFGR